MRLQILAAAGLALATLTGCATSGSPEPAPASPTPTGGAALLGAEWHVTEIAGAGIVPHSKPTILFDDGRVSGAGSCNRFMGGYTLSDDGMKIEFSQMASTMMACPEELMRQEGMFLKTLADVKSYSVSGGVLTLSTPDGRSIKAKR